MGRGGGGGGRTKGAGGDVETAEYKEITSVTEINDTQMKHFTKEEVIAKINAEGFRDSTNSMYGKGVYFTDQNLTSYGVPITVKLGHHKQLFIKSDLNVPSVVSDIAGVHQSDAKFPQAMIKAGYGSMRFKVDDATYTVVFDKSLIKIKS
jgi:hypothetical protein